MVEGQDAGMVITLVGGPFDGKEFKWSGSDVLDFELSPPPHLKPLMFRGVPMPERIRYLRSQLDAVRFIYQP